MQWVIIYLIFFVIIAVSVILGQVHKNGISSTINKYFKRTAISNISSNELAEELLKKANKTEIEIVKKNSKRTNCFSPKFNVIKLSSENFDSPSIVSLAIAAKEAEHAKSKHCKYYYSFRFVVAPILNVISILFIPMVLLSAILVYAFDLEFVGFIITIVIFVLYLLNILIYELLVLPEKKLSRKALESLKNEDIFTEGELEIFKLIFHCLDRTYITTYLLSIFSFFSMLDYQKIMTTN